MDCKILRYGYSLSVFFLSLFLSSFSYSGETYITVNDAKNIELSERITKVFVSDPDVVDYNVINENSIVIFSKAVGQARLMIYGESEKLLYSERIIADIDLSQVRRQVALLFPDTSVKIESVGNQVAVSGIVNSERERDDIYRLVATLLGREKTREMG